MRRSRRCGKKATGFTLVELLVVIAIIGILVALLLPAVQAAREASRRTQCKNQVKQLALGCVVHQEALRHFPTGGWGWDWVGDPDRGFGPDQPGSWMFNILPYMEQGPLHDLGSDGNPDTITPQQMEGASQVIQSPLAILTCPTRRPVVPFKRQFTYINANSRMDAVGRSDYAANSGPTINELEPGPSSYERAKSHRWSSDSRQDVLMGISHQRSEVRVGQIEDGTSNTYLIGEKHVRPMHYETGQDGGDDETWCSGFVNDNARVGRFTPVGDSDNFQISNSRFRFGSAHPAGWNVAFCDGSVHFLSFDINETTHLRLSHRSDGEVADRSQL